MKCASFLLVAVLVTLWSFGPDEPVETHVAFDPCTFSESVQASFESVEAPRDNVRPGSDKRVIWRDGFYEQRMPVSLVYIHGSSAQAREIRPVPD